MAVLGALLPLAWGGALRDACLVRTLSRSLRSLKSASLWPTERM